MTYPAHRPTSRKGITLPELIVALSVFAIAIAVLINFYKETLVDTHFEAQKNELNATLRNLTGELLHNARQADYILLYKSFNPRDRQDPSDRLFEGKEGDLIVMIMQGKGKDQKDSNKRPITKIIGYYRSLKNENQPEEAGTLKRFVVDIPNGSFKEPETLLPQNETKKFKEISTGVSGLTNFRAFYNLNNKNLMANMSLSAGSSEYQYSHRLNLTLSPKE